MPLTLAPSVEKSSRGDGACEYGQDKAVLSDEIEKSGNVCIRARMRSLLKCIRAGRRVGSTSPRSLEGQTALTPKTQQQRTMYERTFTNAGETQDIFLICFHLV